MKQLTTTAIILQRTDYGEADRILTLLTPEYGKLRLMAKGVRRVKSKLAGGIELFSVSHITFIKGRGDMGTLASTRLEKHYKHIVEHLDRTMLGYELIKKLHRATEDEPEPEYFDILQAAFEALDEVEVPLQLISFWFTSQLLGQSGHTPNLQTDEQGNKLQPDKRYAFDTEHMCFVLSEQGRFDARHIKFLRLVFAGNSPRALRQIQGVGELLADCRPLIDLPG